ncbi:MAG: TrpB-like pyridoxal phosphate-dependent enzyme [Clostridiaceae bacterium]
MSDNYRYLLKEEDIPKAWYNISPDMPIDIGPVLDPITKKPATFEYLSALFPKRFLQENASMERWIEIPKPVRDIYKIWRPSPLIRARRLEKALDTPAHLYYKFEGLSPVGSHKPNSAVPQALYAKEEGVKSLVTETGAGQWGSALSMACNFFGIDCNVFMVKVSYDQKPFRRIVMENYGAKVVPSPSNQTEYGRSLLAQNPDHLGSLGIAISESIDAILHSGGKFKYALGSGLNAVLMHQTVVGLEAQKQFEMADEYPDILIGCIGGGSNFAGFTFPFLKEKLTEGKKMRIIAVEPIACPSLTKGVYAFDYVDTQGIGPIAKVYTLGHDFIPPSIHAGGLRLHFMAQQVSALYDHGDIEAVAVSQESCFEAAVKFLRAEGFIPAPESSHAIKVAIDEAMKCKEEGVSKVIAFNVSGHGLLDLSAYDQYLHGTLKDTSYPAEEVEQALKNLPLILE